MRPRRRSGCCHVGPSNTPPPYDWRTRIDDDLHARLKAIATQEQRSVNAVVTEALEAVVARGTDPRRALRQLVLEGPDPVVVSEIALLEATRAFAGAVRGGRLDAPLLARVVEQLQRDTGDDGPVTLIRLDPGPTLERASAIVLAHPVGSVDAVHLAVAEREGRLLADEMPLRFVTRDRVQAQAATDLGLDVA